MGEVSSGAWSASRSSAAPLPQPSRSALVVGVSAFAFQGTNAHTLLRAPDGAASVQKAEADWARQRFWVAVKPHSGMSTFWLH